MKVKYMMLIPPCCCTFENELVRLRDAATRFINLNALNSHGKRLEIKF